MAASAYAALASLYNVLEQIQHPVRHRLFDTSQLETLRQMVSFLLDLFADYSKVVCATDVQDIVRLITNCAQEAEDIIDSHVVDHLIERSADKAHIGDSSFCEAIERLIQKMKRIKKPMVEFTEEESSSQTQQRPSVSMPIPYGKKTMVGFDDHLDQITDRLKGGESSLQIVPIVGMGGIGKTTLARNVFHDPCFKDHFDVHIWFTISQEYSIQDILLGLLHGKEKLGDKKNKESKAHDIAKLREELHQKLFGQTYLIVLDDVWSTNVWDDLKVCFPDNKKGSRIIVTTRLSSVADTLGGHNSYSVGLLDDEKSWELFCEEVFGKKGCHDPELEKFGKDIANGCKGLPLAIIVIGGLLSKSNMTREYWEEVAKNVNSIVNSKDDELCLNILSLSYHHLPIHLKPCFLYMRIFPEDYKINFSKLIRYWIAEGFVISKGGKSLEEVGEEYLEDLIGRNLILINIQEEYDTGRLTKKKMCGIHDLLRDLCIREHQKEYIFHITKIYDENLVKRRDICFMCMNRDESRTVSLPLLSYDDLPKSFATCLLCDICGMICPRLYKLRWASIINPEDYGAFPLPTKLGFLHLSRTRFVSISLPLFWNLQNLILDLLGQEIDLPSEIWEMPQLRHVKIRYAIFHDPPVTPNDRKDLVILENLETLGNVLEFRCSEEFLERIPNLKKLKISYENEEDNFSYYLLHNLALLCKLESLFLEGGFLNREMIAFPHSLKKLVLDYVKFSWEELTIIGLLPNLEVLRLRECATGEEWNPVEGEFLQLKLLSIRGSEDLVYWNAEREHFPKLESLALLYMWELQKFPSGIGEIDTLLSICLRSCPKSVVDSAKEIVEEQKTYGNEVLHLRIVKY